MMVCGVVNSAGGQEEVIVISFHFSYQLCSDFVAHIDGGSRGEADNVWVEAGLRGVEVAVRRVRGEWG